MVYQDPLINPIF